MDAEPAPDPAPDPTTSRTSHDVVVAFLDALQALDVDAASALMAPDISYRNVPFPAVRGPRATVAMLRSFLVLAKGCLLYTSPSPRDRSLTRMPSSA